MKLTSLEAEITWRFIRGTGPGGQNVNKVSSAAQLRLDIMGTTSLTAAVKQRLVTLAGNRMNQLGELIITANTQRTQGANRADALARLYKLIHRASQPEKKRIKTKPSRAAIARTQQTKKAQSEKKQRRATVRRHLTD